MADKIKQIPKRLVEIWKSWTNKQKIIIIGSTVAFLAVIAILAIVLNQPNYQVLTTCTDYTELSQVTTLLKDGGYDYKVGDNSLVVKVRKAKLTEAKMVIATADIVSDGYTFDDAMKSSFSTTESDKTKQYEHYLEAKFGNDLSSIDGVKSASVTVDIADATSSFYQQTSESSVAAVLELTKSISDDTAESMANFLATAVNNSTTNNITIISSNGDTLFSGASNASNVSGTSFNNQQKFKSQIESTTKSSMKQNLLSSGLYDDAYLTLNYVLDWDAVNSIATEYSVLDGYEQGLFKTSSVTDSTGSNGTGGTPGTTSNSSDDATTYNITDGDNSTSTYHVENYEYLPNELVTTTTREPGSIIYNTSSLAVTFVKNMVYKEDECKKLGYLDNMTWDQFKAQNAESTPMDVDNNWVDLLSKGTGINTNNISVMAYQRPYFEDSVKTSVFTRATFWIQIALAAIILGLLTFVVLRSARPLTVEEKEPELSVEEMLASTKENQPSVDEIDLQEKSETRKAIEKFVDENPEAVALLLRNWLNDGWN